MWKLFGNKTTDPGRTKRIKRSYIIYAVLITAGALLIAASSSDFIAGRREYSAARKEYEMLGEYYPAITSFLESLRDTEQNQGSDGNTERTDGTGGTGVSGDRATDIIGTGDGSQNPFKELREINPDFIGWISIDGIISYPVVLAENNEYYLDRTFSGMKNPAGTVFMDSRNEMGFDSVVCILYGHNMKDKTMFAQLHKYRDSAFMEANPVITIITSSGEILTYRVFAARLVNDVNRAYRLNFANYAAAARVFPNPPDDGSRFLLLSTCTNSSYDFERLLVYAALAS